MSFQSGTLPRAKAEPFRFGVSIFPSLYADALYALDTELDRVFDTERSIEPAPFEANVPSVSENGTRFRTLTIGRSVVFEDYDVKIRIDDFFGGHAAVLGNTGSGKSCTVASVLQSLFGKTDEYRARGATFVVFDVNGEYKQALEPLANDCGIGLSHVVLDGTADEGSFRLPHWFLEQSEWELLLQASEKTQTPILRTALGLTSLFRIKDAESLKIKEHFIATCIIQSLQGADGDSPVSKLQRVMSLLQNYSTEDLHMGLLETYKANYKYGNFENNNQKPFLEEVTAKLCKDVELPSYVHAPFSFDDLGECLNFAILYEEAHGNRHIRGLLFPDVNPIQILEGKTRVHFSSISD